MTVSKARAYWQLMRMDRPVGSFLLLWPTLWALILSAQGLPDPGILCVFILGVLLMRSAGCVINDFADRHVDGYVKRTQSRPLPAGLVTAKEAVSLFFVLSIASFVLVLTMNRLTIQLSFVCIALVFIYPFMKRFTHLPQLFLGMAFSWSIPMAWAAQANSLPAIVWFIFITNVMWTVAYDTQYAMADRDDDLKIGIKSTAILFGRYDKLIVGILQLITLLMLIGIGVIYQLGAAFYWSVLAASGLFVYQQHLIRHRDRLLCFQAFLNNNYVGMVITVGLLVSMW